MLKKKDIGAVFDSHDATGAWEYAGVNVCDHKWQGLGSGIAVECGCYDSACLRNWQKRRFHDINWLTVFIMWMLRQPLVDLGF
jgi:hypothetical protein